MKLPVKSLTSGLFNVYLGEPYGVLIEQGITFIQVDFFVIKSMEHLFLDLLSKIRNTFYLWINCFVFSERCGIERDSLLISKVHHFLVVSSFVIM